MTEQLATTRGGTLRLVFPQWQGGGRSPDYIVGSRLLAWLAPASSDDTIEVLVEPGNRGLTLDGGILGREIVLEHARTVRAILAKRQPDRVVIFGGDCSVDFAPFTYLSERYGDDLALLWLDAHPDLSVPGGESSNFHSMPLAALVGECDPDFLAENPAPIDPARVMYVGLRAGRTVDLALAERLRISMWEASVDKVSRDSSVVLEWLRDTGVRHVAVHFDLDVLDPSKISTIVGPEPDGLSMETVARLLTDVASEFDIVGLGITEFLPKEIARLQELLSRLPLVAPKRVAG